MASAAFASAADLRLARAPPKSVVLMAIGVGGLTAAGISFALALESDEVAGQLGEPLVVAMLTVWLTLSYILCGLVAWWRRPASRFGPLMVAAGFANFFATLVWSTNDILFTFGQTLDLVPPVIFLHVFLAFPDGRLRGRFVRVLVAIAYATAIGLEPVRMYFGGFGSSNLLEHHVSPGVSQTVLKVQMTMVSVFCLVGVGVLIVRRLRAVRRLRRSLGLFVDAFAVGLVMIAFLFGSAAYGGPWVAQIRWATFGTLALAPTVFLIGLLSARLARSALTDLVVELRADLTPSDLRDALARTLRDPSLELAYWLPQFETYADVEGQPLDLQTLGRGRGTTLIDRKGEHVAALLHDRSLQDEPELLAAVTAAAGIAVENGRLQAELRARLEELRGSRARVIAAGQKERQRLERNLHDGAQQRLIALSLELSRLEQRLGADPDAQMRLDQARREIALSLSELRDVARGIHPAVVSGHGLKVALESIVARASLPVRLRVDLEGRQEEPLEVAAYYVVSESLANIAKHARATSATVDVSRKGRQIVVEVIDDGVGGADTERGTGLRGLADRVEALGGRLRVWTPRGGGTRVKAELPCA
jgi:signal transduction histidine kinase